MRNQFLEKGKTADIHDAETRRNTMSGDVVVNLTAPIVKWVMSNGKFPSATSQQIQALMPSANQALFVEVMPSAKS
jgi:hypothetical protein